MVGWFAWLIAVILLDPWQALAKELDWTLLPRLAFHNALTILPPALTAAVCEVMTFPVLRQLRKLDLPWGQLKADAFFGRLWFSLPAALMWTGFRTASSGSRHATSILALVPAGLIVFLLFQVFWFRRRVANTFKPHSLTVGALRDRAFAMAERASVKLNQIYVYPMAKWQMANAFASQGNNLLLTDWLLSHLTIREVDAIIGHELAHMKRGHVSKQSWVLIVLWGMPVVWLRSQGVMPDLAWSALFLFGSWHATKCLRAVLSRRHEREADLEGVRINGDPGAFISALRQLERLNSMPHELNSFEEALSTHPSTQKRIEAIERLNFPSRELPPEGIDGAGSYALPEAVEAAAQGDTPVFDSTLKREIVNRFTVRYMFTIGLPPVLIGIFAAQPDSSLISSVIWLGGLTAYACLIVRMTDRAGRKPQSNLRPKLLERLTRRFGPIPEDAHFVGLSPGSEVRLFEGCYSWDLGFFWMDGEVLRYVGEQTHFALRRDQLSGTRLAPGAPRWRRTQRVCIDWVTPQGSKVDTMAFSCPGEKSFSADGRAAGILVESVEKWRDGREHESCNSKNSCELPVFGEITSTSPRDSLRLGRYISTLVMVLAVPTGVVVGGEIFRQDLVGALLVFVAIGAGHTFACLPTWRFKPSESAIKGNSALRAFTNHSPGARSAGE
ncbi:MAG: peptidase Ste24p [Verrucomicrobiales bacterium]|nr:peptidase Ste24p [Verrucomicrobiales bacterium]